jgi:hypothetical protein
MQGNENHFRLFMSFSSLLTGYAEFDLFGTGCAELYCNTVSTSLAGGSLNSLLAEWEKIEKRLRSEKGRMDAVMALLNGTGGDDWLKLSQNIATLWYMGQWTDPVNNATLIPSPLAYQEGLAWPAMLAHVQGGKEEGYAMWATKPGTTQF